MTTLDVEIAELRRRRSAPTFMARLRRLPLLERRAIRDPDERDLYWARVRVRLAQSDAASQFGSSSLEAPERPAPSSMLIG